MYVFDDFLDDDVGIFCSGEIIGFVEGFMFVVFWGRVEEIGEYGFVCVLFCVDIFGVSREIFCFDGLVMGFNFYC